MIAHPNRNRAVRARNKWLDAAKAWNREATRRFGRHFTEDEGRGEEGSELRRLYERKMAARSTYLQFTIGPVEPRAPGAESS